MILHRARTLLTALLGLSILLGNLLTPAFLEAQLTGAMTPQNQPDPLSAKVSISEPSSISSDQAIAAALNTIESTPAGFSLRNPRHKVFFTSTGVEFSPRNSSLTLTWRLASVTAGNKPLAGMTLGAIPPLHDSPLAVSYLRGGLVEQYLSREDTLEQQFLILQPLPLNGADLVIAGEVHSQGRFEVAQDGWLWRLGDQAVHLGKVRVFDAAGKDLPASMQATASSTRITVDSTALASAIYPVTIDPEFGTNDYRVSYMGRDPLFDAFIPANAYNSTDDEYLVVWYADDDEDYLADNEYEIYAQRVNANDGSLVGSMIAVSNMGTNGYDFIALNPAVAYNSTNNQYLVVWEGDDLAGSLVNDEFEIYGQLLTASGAQISPDDYRLSDMGGSGNADYDAIRPAVAYNSALNQYLVVWQGDDGGSLANDEFEIYGQLLTSSISGAPGTPNDFRISDMGPDGDAAYDANSPAVTYNSQTQQYLVAWSGSDDTGGMAVGEKEIFIQILNGTGGEEGHHNYRISDMGGLGNTTYATYFPDVAYNSTDNEFLVVWYGDDSTNEEYEIYGQLLEADGDGVPGTGNDFRISDMGPDTEIAYYAEYPAVTYNSLENQYLVVWQGVDDTPPLVAGEQEIFCQRLTATGGATGSNDFRLSHMGPDGNNPYSANRPAVAFNSLNDEFLVTWYGDDDSNLLIMDEYEVFGERLNASGSFLGNQRISYMEPVGNPAFDAAKPSIVYNSNWVQTLTVWSGDTNMPPLVDNEYEIFGKLGIIHDPIEFRISHVGGDGIPSRGAFDPAVTYNSEDYQYLVVWRGDGEATDNEYEVYGQLIDSNGTLIGGNFRISDMGPNGSAAYGAYSPDATYNRIDNQYLVVWSGDDDTGSLVDNEYEIFGQFLEADGDETGTNDFRISDMGGTGDAAYGASEPAATYNDSRNEYLVVWHGDDDTGSMVDNEFEIFGQLLESDGGGTGTNDFRISDMGGTGSTVYNAYSPDVVYAEKEDEFLVVWYGDDDIAPLVSNEYEIFGQRLNETGGGAGSNDFRISDMGPHGNPNYDAYYPAIDYNSNVNRYLVVWYGDDGLPLSDDEFEIYGQLLTGIGVSTSVNDLRISDMGPDGDPSYNASAPAVVSLTGIWSSVNTGYFIIAWEGDDNVSPLVNDENEIFGQVITTDTRLYLPIIHKSP